MKTIGEKQRGIEYIYVMLFIVSSAFIIVGIETVKVISSFLMVIIGIILVIWSIWTYIDIVRTPKVIIEYNKMDSTIILKKSIIISIISIKDVSYIKARNKGVTYKWGKIIIETSGEKYQCNYVKDCEEVAKTITKLMYKNEL